MRVLNESRLSKVGNILMGSMTGRTQCPRCERANLFMEYKEPKLWCGECGYTVFVEFTEGESA